MKSLFRKQVTFCVFAWMLVILRMADAHAHLCSDGKEPPATIHLADGGTHPCETGDASGHTGDKDVQLAADVLLKKAALDEAWLPASPTITVEYVAQSFGEAILGVAQIDGTEISFFLWPPLRGPPA